MPLVPWPLAWRPQINTHWLTLQYIYIQGTMKLEWVTVYGSMLPVWAHDLRNNIVLALYNLAYSVCPLFPTSLITGMGYPALPRVITDFSTTGMGKTALPSLPINSLYDSDDWDGKARSSTSITNFCSYWLDSSLCIGLQPTGLDSTGTATTMKYKSTSV